VPTPYCEPLLQVVHDNCQYICRCRPEEVGSNLSSTKTNYTSLLPRLMHHSRYITHWIIIFLLIEYVQEDWWSSEHQIVTYQFHQEFKHQLQNKVHLKLTWRAINICNDPQRSPQFFNFVLRLLRLTWDADAKMQLRIKFTWTLPTSSGCRQLLLFCHILALQHFKLSDYSIREYELRGYNKHLSGLMLSTDYFIREYLYSNSIVYKVMLCILTSVYHCSLLCLLLVGIFKVTV